MYDKSISIALLQITGKIKLEWLNGENLINTDLNIGDGQAVNTFDPFGDHLSNVTPPWPTLLIGIYVSMAGAHTCSMHP